MTTFPRKVDRWETSDGKTHRTEQIAVSWQSRLHEVRDANDLIERGHNLADVFTAIGQPFVEADREILSQITRDAMLIISHWQCRDQPGYSLVRLENEGGFWVWGNAGSWSGSYGATVDYQDLVRYACDTAKRCGGALPKRA